MRSKILILALVLLFSACSDDDDSENILMVKATVRLLAPPNGCDDYIIETENDNLLFPQNLDKEYLVDGLKVNIIYDLVEGVTHQCGRIGALPSIELLEIEKSNLSNAIARPNIHLKTKYMFLR
ncbi:hypothetical protein [Allomuricauda sp. SCSIO 65647]|uniref:hypothetical protein n=1 Tax=Allomuricauda sp. SCSIO 65647 TaxID=2908843 RepID=UPI001F1B7DDC|nr:hypothetical protein [Muricauda sp. SCSIO 65647]UJH67793.1 hypothetical protein L0P89_00905 [Muricauda sp. SCSIO 65647]